MCESHFTTSLLCVFLHSWVRHWPLLSLHSSGLLSPLPSVPSPPLPSPVLLSPPLAGAHHLDLRASTAADPPSVRWQRAEERRHIARWIAEHRREQGMEGEAHSGRGGPPELTDAKASSHAVGHSSN